MATLKAIREKDERDKRFFASLQGVDLESNSQPEEVDDITTLTGYQASKEGFGLGMGLGYIGE